MTVLLLVIVLSCRSRDIEPQTAKYIFLTRESREKYAYYDIFVPDETNTTVLMQINTNSHTGLGGKHLTFPFDFDNLRDIPQSNFRGTV
jgi:hypothetical protein